MRASVFRAKSAHEKDHEADEEHEAEAAAADGGTANVKAAAAEQEEKNNDQKDKVHGCTVTGRGRRGYGALPAE